MTTNQVLRRCRRAVLACGLLLLLALPLHAQVRVHKIEIKHVGPAAAADALVRANIRVKEGELFSRAAVDDDVRNLYATGFFYNIRVAEEMTPEGVVLTYFVQGKPRLTEIRFQGNEKFSTDKLRKKITSKVGEPLDERKLFNDTRAIKEMYQKAGLQKTDVKYVLSIDEQAGRGTATFEITETPKVRVIDVVFDGAQAFPQKKLAKVIKTRKHWMFSWITGSGKLKDEQLEDDKEKLSDFYRNEGYIDFDLKDVRYEYEKTNRLVLRFVLSEGRQYKVGHVGVQGASLFTTNEVLAVLRMTNGALFTPKGLNTDVEAVRDLYGAKGYIDARVEPRKIPNVEQGTMDLVYAIAESDQVFIEKVEIKGNVKTKDKVIRRELAVAPGEVFDMVKVKRSKARLEQMNFFERVETKPEDTDVPNRKNLVVAVDEKNTGNFTIGAGFSSIDSLVAYAELTQGNFDLFKPPTFQGAGQKFRLRVALGLERQDYLVSFIEPWFLDRKLAFGVDLYHREWTYLSDLYDERRTGVKLSLTRTLGSDFLLGTVSTTVESIGIHDLDYSEAPGTIFDAAGSYLAARLGFSLAYDTRNSATYPNRGQRSELFTELVAGDFSLWRAELRTAWYFPGLAEGHVIEVLGRLGVMDSLGDGVDTPSSTLPPNDVPFFERFYLGGPYSLRGFRYRDVGPREWRLSGLAQEAVGGNSYYMVSVEYTIPIIERFKIAAFYDMGNVFYDTFDFDFASFCANVGLGFRLNLPIGPLRLDYGIPIKAANDERMSGRFNFTVGYTRDF